MYDNTAKDPIACEEKRASVVRSALERLETLAGESDNLVERLQSTFSPVLLHVPTVGCEVIRDSNANPGSDLGQALMRLADQIDGNFRAIHGIIEMADV